MTDEQKAEIKALWDAGGLTAEEIGRRFGVTKGAVTGLVDRGGWKPRGGKKPDAGLRKSEWRAIEAVVGSIRKPKHSSCQWPEGDPTKPGYHQCGAEPVEGFPYCDAHCKRAYQYWGEEKRPLELNRVRPQTLYKIPY